VPTMTSALVTAGSDHGCEIVPVDAWWLGRVSWI
jgi:hypothetical protein